ncbi:MAG: DUF1810 domain-containing protein [Mariprofundaceae bacterium]|nr:DUF1810 domain-containing protein [Mariprofundaceae bacterium]
MSLDRFLEAHNHVYDDVLSELCSGRKRTHWMWFIFPQIAGLGRSSTAKFYAIKNLHEAHAYLNHPVLGSRLVECAETLLRIQGKSANDIFGHPDDMKLKSSMTLFASIAGDDSPFSAVLKRYFHGELDKLTLDELLPKL